MATEKQVYEALIAAGFDRSQAAGIMGNLENESGFDQEIINPAGPQSGVGLAQWQTTDYPAASGYVTGNPAKDLETQVRAIVAAARGLHLGGTAQEVASTWAADFERCAGCEPGGAQNASRQANALRIYRQAQSGNWPNTPGSGIQGGGTAPSSGATSAQLTSFLSSPSGVLSDAGALLHGSAVVLDRVFGMFAPGQGWRGAFALTGLFLLYLSWRAFGA